MYKKQLVIYELLSRCYGHVAESNFLCRQSLGKVCLFFSKRIRTRLKYHQKYSSVRFVCVIHTFISSKITNVTLRRKSVRIRSCSGHFATFGLNTDQNNSE